MAKSKYIPTFRWSSFNHVAFTLVRTQAQLDMVCPINDKEVFMGDNPKAHAMCAFRPQPSGQVHCIIQMPLSTAGAKMTRIQALALLTHEVTHLWQCVRDEMSGSEKPSYEFEAYSMQQLMHDVLDMYAASENSLTGAKYLLE